MKQFTLPIFIVGLVIFLTWSCSLYDDSEYELSEFQIEDLVKEVQLSRNSILANGSDTISIFIELPLEADTTEMMVETSLGTFVNSGTSKFTGSSVLRNFDGLLKNVIEVKLISGLDVGIANIQYQVAGFQDVVEVEFRRSYPREIKLTPDKIGVENNFGSEVNLTIQVKAANGEVSNEHPLELFATDTLGNSIGYFRINPNFYSDSSTATFTVAPDTSYVGIIDIIINTPGESETVSDTLSIYSL